MEPGEFLRAFPLDAHRDAEGSDLQVTGLAVQHLGKQVARSNALEIACAPGAARDLPQVRVNGHGL